MSRAVGVGTLGCAGTGGGPRNPRKPDRGIAAAVMLRSPTRLGRRTATAGGEADSPRPVTVRVAGRLQRPDILAVAVLAVVPVLIFGVPAMLGHPVWPGDDLTQNYPLRVLVGQQLRAGQLPLYDPYIWSGAPLLADWNAGAAYPLTWLFAVLPGIAAWSINLVVIWLVAGIGMFCFLRRLRLGSLASFLGALCFAFAGAMPAQVGHLGLVAGMSWVPVELLAVLALTEDRGLRSRLAWVSVLALTFGLTILAGEPRAIDDAGLVLVIFAAWRVAMLGRRFVPAAAWVAGGLALGSCLGAVQLLPGLAAVATSQRAANSLALFNAGSLAPKWLLLIFVPDLLGGSGSFSQPSFLASYNLAEVTSYVGILPLVAALALLGRLRLRSRPPEWLVWHIVAVVGLLFALGGNTPLGRLLVHVPLFGDQRLQSRSILVADLALAILLAYWADRPLPDGDRRPAVHGLLRRADLGTLLGILPPLAVIAVALLGITRHTALLSWMGVASSVAASAGGRLGPWLIPYAVLGVAAVALVVAASRISPRLRTGLVAAFVVADVVVFTVLAVVAVAPHAGSGQDVTASKVSRAAAAHPSGHARKRAGNGAPAVRPVSALGYPGRFAIYDPRLLDGAELTQLGSPDLNVMSGTPSVQGYSSIVDGRYASATGAHHAVGDGQDVLAPKAVADGVLGQLDTSVLLTLPGYLVTAADADGPAAGPPGTGRRVIRAGGRTTWYFGAALAVSKVQVADGQKGSAAGLRVGLMTPGGRVHWFAAAAGSTSTLVATLPRPLTSVAVVGLAGPGGAVLGPPAIVARGRGVLVADGILQDALQPPQWAFAGQDGSFGIFADRDAQGALRLVPSPGTSAAGDAVTALGGPADDPIAAAVQSPHGVRLIRSVAAIPGWTARWQPRKGPAVPLVVHRAGVVQEVDVPPGLGTVTWSYKPPLVTVGAAASAAAIVVVLLLLLLAWLWPQFAGRRSPEAEAEAAQTTARV